MSGAYKCKVGDTVMRLQRSSCHRWGCRYVQSSGFDSAWLRSYLPELKACIKRERQDERPPSLDNTDCFQLHIWITIDGFLWQEEKQVWITRTCHQAHANSSGEQCTTNLCLRNKHYPVWSNVKKNSLTLPLSSLFDEKLKSSSDNIFCISFHKVGS